MSKVYAFTDFGGPEHELLTDRAAPEPGPGQLAVEVRAAGVNPADWKIRQGWFGRAMSLPAPMGVEVSGVVTAVGEGVVGFRTGDAVLGHPVSGLGGFAEHTVLSTDEVVAKPEAVPFPDAATIPVAGTTAYDLTHAVDLQPGATVVVLGAGGGVGLAAAQLAAKVLKARVLGVASEGKRELVESTGATFVASGQSAAEAVRGLAPDGVDLLVDLVGGKPLRDLAPLVSDRGCIQTAADSDAVTELGAAARAYQPDTLARVTALYGAGVIQAHVTATFPLERAREALAAVETGHTAGKVVIVPE